MDDTRRPGLSFADDLDEFDRLLADDDVDVAPTPRAQRTAVRPAPGAASDLDDAPVAPNRRPRLNLRVTPDWNRIAAVLFVAAVVLFVIYFAVSSILDARRTGAYEDYYGAARDIAAQSTAQGSELDTILTSNDGGDRSQRIASIEQLARRADKLADEATALEVPEQLAGAHSWLETSLDYRARGIASVQRSLSASIDSKDADASAAAVAAALARLVASDVVWTDSFVAESRRVLTADDVQGVTVPTSVVIADLDVAAPSAVAAMLVRLKSSGATTEDGATPVPDDGKIRGGQLEGGRVTVEPSGQTLAINQLVEIKGGDDVEFAVPFTNQGEVQLTDVKVSITLRGDDSDPVELTELIESVDPGETATAKVSLDEIPTFGEVLEMDILVGPIAGEKTTDNNRASYQVQFSV